MSSPFDLEVPRRMAAYWHRPIDVRSIETPTSRYRTAWARLLDKKDFKPRQVAPIPFYSNGLRTTALLERRRVAIVEGDRDLRPLAALLLKSQPERESCRLFRQHFLIDLLNGCRTLYFGI